ncbi:hypothetical protein J7T55_007656 [Diaporthe amygdali]|uniref:uncharacterized protein n=1 Tax=Phomopsis amygdali TaxID=1214568 RepID=UPI0022FF1451|nr:uncharacterized protein J7T55_007656 [Diaporthe amygdali]KAJ0107467.1 hypothetical protein J7T55_007656 [Diaporthe amygdali]
MNLSDVSIETDQIREWRSIITLIVFLLANIAVLFPFHIPIYVPGRLWHAAQQFLCAIRVISPRTHGSHHEPHDGKARKLVCKRFPMNSVTAPLIADLFLLAILAIGRDEVKAGTLGDNGIFPIDIMIFFITLAYIAISIDASGLIRYLALKVLQWGANIASAILVSSNPTNLVLAGAFNIKFINYTANMVVPVIVTAVVLFPFLLYIVFANEGLIPVSITMRELPAEAKLKPAVNPNIPNARGIVDDEEEAHTNDDQGQLLSLVEIMNPFLDKGGAAFGAIIMSVTLITVLAINAASVKAKNDDHFQVFWVTLPAAFVMLCWDLAFGWIHREDTRAISRRGRQEVERARRERALRGDRITEHFGGRQLSTEGGVEMLSITRSLSREAWPEIQVQDTDADTKDGVKDQGYDIQPVSPGRGPAPLLTLTPAGRTSEASISPAPEAIAHLASSMSTTAGNAADNSRPSSSDPTVFEKRDDLPCAEESSFPVEDVLISGIDESANKNKKCELDESTVSNGRNHSPPTLISLCKDGYRWSQETFPTVMAVISHLPFALVPFAFSMFVLVQALVTKGWVSVFAYGWDHWVHKTGTIGAIGGMGFLSVIFCNRIHMEPNSSYISDRTFWATVYTMALGVNYGAFSTAFSASLAGLLWRDILKRKHIHIRRMEFARVNVPIIAIAMTVGCTVLVGEVYIIRKETPYSL